MIVISALREFVHNLAPFTGTVVAVMGVLLAVDLPAVAQQASPPTVEPVLKAYSCPAVVLEATVARLRSEFQRVPGVRIVADGRRGQILVHAPPDVQSRIAQRLSIAPPNSGPQPSRPVSANQPAFLSSAVQRPQFRSVRLGRSTARQIESALVGMLGNRLSPVTGAGLGVGSYRLALPGSETINLGIHHQTNMVTVEGIGVAVDSCVRLIEALDGPPPTAARGTRLVSLRTASPASLWRVIDAIRAGNAPRRPPGPLVTMLFQQRDQEPPAPGPDGEPPGPPPPENGAPGDGPPEGARPGDGPGQERTLIGPVEIQMLEGLDVIIIRGHPRDVEQVMAIIEQIERISEKTVPAIEIYHVKHVNCEALADLIIPLYDQVFSPRQGSVSITALVKPNALLLIGRTENVQTVLDLVKRLDRPVAPETQFRVFPLRHAAAATAQAMVTEFFADRPGLGTRVRVTADFRSNSLIVQAGSRDVAEVAELIARIDTPTSEAVHELRVFKLQNSLADELAPILQGAITGQAAAAAAAPGQQAAAGAEQKSLMLRFLTIDTKGRRRLESGILTDVRVTADPRANTLLVSAPAQSMELIEALIRELDKLPSLEAQIKVFTIVNGDAPSLMDMLETLFAPPTGAGQPAVQTAAVEGESSLVQLRFAVDVRTNSIIASGSRGDLTVVEAILLRLDASEVRQRETQVYRLRNAPALDVSNAVNEFLRTERQVLQIQPGLLSAFEQIEREVVVVPEPVSNSLIVSATPRFFKQIMELVQELDERPPMVMIQVLIAEVQLNDIDEFGVELGLQDSILFDRSLLGDISTTTQTVYDAVTGLPVSSSETIQSATYTPGFAFNNQSLGNSGSTQALDSSQIVGSQGLSHFAVGRMNNELGFGGLVLSASSEGVSILIRALQESRRLEVLSRPQIMTLDNQPAFIQVGQRVPRVTAATIDEQTGQQITTTLENVGLILGVTPRISPDGIVVMEIDAEKSEMGPEEEGIPIFISTTGEVLRSPRINNTTAQTTVSAVDGQTVILGGLITKSKSDIHRKVPFLGDLPLLGDLFRYDATVVKRAELLIIMTPHIVQTEEDAEEIKYAEASRMSWCLADVLELTDDAGLRCRADDWADSETRVIYPDLEPDGRMITVPDSGGEGPEIAPTPNENPFKPEMVPTPSSPLRPTPTPTRAPPRQPASGTGPPEPLPVPADSELKLHPLDQSHYRPPAYRGGVEQAVYQRPGAPAYGGPGPVVPSTYYAPPPYQQPPMARPVRYQQPPLYQQPPQYRQPPVARPLQYQQPPVTQPTQPRMPLYR